MKKISVSDVITNSSSEVFIMDWDPTNGYKDLDESGAFRITKEMLLDQTKTDPDLREFMEYYFDIKHLWDQDELNALIELVGQDKLLEVFEGKWLIDISDHDSEAFEELFEICEDDHIFWMARSGRIYGNKYNWNK